jgi:urea transporter
MKHRDPARHPGVFRVMQVDSEVAGIFVALGFVLMAIVSIPIAKWFVAGALLLGVSVTLLLRYSRQ